jgi:hypothetical protein
MKKNDLLAVIIALAIMIPFEGFLLTRAANEDKVGFAQHDKEMTLAENAATTFSQDCENAVFVNDIAEGSCKEMISPETAFQLIQDPVDADYVIIDKSAIKR